MADKEKAETTIRIYKSTKDKLKELKFGNEGDAVVIARLIEENKQLKEKNKQTKIEKINIVRNMIKKDFSLEDIQDITGKSIEEIKKIKKELTNEI